MTLYTYVVVWDFGFAPNPFWGLCTLATCKPMIRKNAQIGDWVVGLGSKQNGLDGRIVYAMRVGETCSYDDYWNLPRFRKKRPNLQGSLKQAFGDNIYHRDPESRQWQQANSHHSFPNGKRNVANVNRDTQSPRVLIGSEFKYWGGSGPSIPTRFRDPTRPNVCCHRGHKCIFPPDFVARFIAWINSFQEKGRIGTPYHWTL